MLVAVFSTLCLLLFVCILFLWVFGFVSKKKWWLNGDEASGDQVDPEQVPAFKEFGLAELCAATNGFSSELIVSESGEKAPNVVYRGKIRSNHLVAIKRFSKQSWPDSRQFMVSFSFRFGWSALCLSASCFARDSIKMGLTHSYSWIDLFHCISIVKLTLPWFTVMYVWMRDDNL